MKYDFKNKVFGRRKSKKLSNLQKYNLEKYLNEFSIFQKSGDGIFYFKKLDPGILFDDLTDIRLEIGFGMGDFLFEKALAYPEVGFIGCEIFENGVASLLTKIIKFKIKNIKVHFGNCFDLIQNLKINTLKKIYILFPDPWPKTKHKKRRFFNESNAIHLCSLLKKNGSINIATDIENYAAQIYDIMNSMENFNCKKSNFFNIESKVYKEFNTKYEKKAFEFGRKTNFLIFDKKS